jgi:hypothetical protein
MRAQYRGELGSGKQNASSKLQAGVRGALGAMVVLSRKLHARARVIPVRGRQNDQQHDQHCCNFAAVS